MQTQAFLKAVSSVGVFLLLAVPGFLLAKKKILTGRQVEGLSSVLVNFLWPAMVVDAMAQVQASRELVAASGARRPYGRWWSSRWAQCAHGSG